MSWLKDPPIDPGLAELAAQAKALGDSKGRERDWIYEGEEKLVERLDHAVMHLLRYKHEGREPYHLGHAVRDISMVYTLQELSQAKEESAHEATSDTQLR